jgi:hypothetical protein
MADCPPARNTLGESRTHLQARFAHIEPEPCIIMAVNTRNLTTIACAAILIGTEVFAIAFAAGWAIAGIFELGSAVQYVLMGLFSLGGLYIMAKFVQMANQVEPIRQ